MEKLGVKLNEAMAKAAQKTQKCPRCGQSLSNTNPPKCDSCGTEPLETKDK